MLSQRTQAATACPVTRASVAAEAQAAFDKLSAYCQTCESPFWLFEKELLVRIAVLGCCLMRLFLTARHERLDVQPYLEDGVYRPGDGYAERKLKTRMVLQVHDELLFEVPNDEKDEIESLVRGEMEGVIKLNVPLVADLGFGPNWRDL